MGVRTVKAQVYDAEFRLRSALANGGPVHAFGSVVTLPEERKFGDLAGVQRYVDLVWKVSYNGPLLAPKVRERRGSKHAHYERMKHVIAVPDHVGTQHSWAMRELVVLHELAHAMTNMELADHGPAFCGTFVTLVREWIGQEAGWLLMAELSERGVQIGKSTI